MYLTRLGYSADPTVEARRLHAEDHGMVLVDNGSHREFFDDWTEISETIYRVVLAKVMTNMQNENRYLERVLNHQIEERNNGTIQ